MEPIRPDHDEVNSRKSDPSQSVGKVRSRNRNQRSAGSGQGAQSRRGGILPVVLVVLVLAVGAGWWLVQQNQAIDQLQQNLGEAEDWISRSKLSMARFEGRLSEADRELLESASKISDKLEFLDSEMRKLWGVAYDRNRKSIQTNKEATEFLESKTEYLDKERAEQRQLIEEQQSRVAAVSQDIEKVAAQLPAVTARQEDIAARQDDLAAQLAATRSTQQDLAAQQEQVQKRVSALLQRQTLGMDELRARLDRLERQVAESGNESAIAGLEESLAKLKEVVDSIDASRAQLTGRLLRLEQRVQGKTGG